MKNTELFNTIKYKNIATFTSCWINIKNTISEKQKQDLLTEILDYYYLESDFAFFVKVFDLIIDSKVSLNFNIDHWSPTFLSLAVDKASHQLFDYFLHKGANLNYIGDSYAFETDETVKQEIGNNLFLRYSTCLDFAELKLADMLSVDYNYHVPEIEEYISSWTEINKEETMTVNKQQYYYLIEQSKYLKDIIHLDRLIDYIKSIGGKTYNELKK